MGNLPLDGGEFPALGAESGDGYRRGFRHGQVQRPLMEGGERGIGSFARMGVAPVKVKRRSAPEVAAVPVASGLMAASGIGTPAESVTRPLMLTAAAPSLIESATTAARDMR